MAGSRQLQLLRFVVCIATLALCLLTTALGEKGNDTEYRVHTDKEIQDEFVHWVDRMGQKYESSAKVKGEGVGVNFATSPSEVTITVDQSGKGDFKSIKTAIEAIPDKSSTRFIVLVKPGTYKEKVKIPTEKGAITLQGSGNRVTTITYDDTASSAGGTLQSSSVMVYSNNFIAKDIAFENTAPAPPPGAVGRQAVAFMIAGDKAAFYGVAFLGYQDTLYDRAGRHYFKDCYIRGSIDFIFGNGQSYYETCYLDVDADRFGSLSAQKRMTAKEETGYSFVNCIVNSPTGYIYLSRAWGPFARVVFIRTYLPTSIRREGWFDWGVPGRSKTVFYGEYQCFGPGADRKGRESWSYELTDAQVKPFLTIDWIEGIEWL